MFANILNIVAILALAFPATVNVHAEEPIFLRAFPDGNAVDGGNWPLGATVHMAIDDPATGAAPPLTNPGLHRPPPSNKTHPPRVQASPVLHSY